MDPTLQAKIDEAKANGYSDEEINAFLRGQSGTPVPTQEQPGRGAEMAISVAPTAASYIPEAVGLGVAGYGLNKYGPDMMRTAGNLISKFSSLRSGAAPGYGMPGGTPIGSPVNAPVAPTNIPVTSATGPTNIPINQPAVPTTNAGRPYSPQAQEFLAQRGAQTAQPSMAQQVQRMAFERLAPIANAARAIAPAAIGAGALFYSPGLNKGEDEELRRRRMMPPTLSQ